MTDPTIPSGMAFTEAEIEAMQHAPPPTPEEVDGVILVLVLSFAAGWLWLIRD